MSYPAGSAFITVGPSLKGWESKLRAGLAPLLKPISISVIPQVDAARARTELDQLGQGRSTTLNVDVDDAAARTQLDALARPRSTTLNVDVDDTAARTKLAALGALASSVSGLGVLGALGTLSAAPVGAGALGVVGAGGGALLGAGGALGAFLPGLIGNLVEAFKAQKSLETAQQQGVQAATAETSAQNALAGTLFGLRSAEENLAQTKVLAARSVQSAQQALGAAQRQSLAEVAAAEQQVTSAQQTAKQAQDALNQARLTARQQLADLTDQLRGAALAESGAQLAVEQAQANLAALKADPTATELQLALARQALKEAQLQADEAAKTNRRTQESAAQARKDGVAGNQQVVDARHQLQQANQATADSERNLARVQAEAARQVAQAQTRLAQARTDGARNVARAEEQVANAQRQVAVAQQQVAEASQASATAQSAIAAAQAKLDSKPIDRFLGRLAALKSTWSGFLRDTAGSALGVAGQAVGILDRLLPRLEPIAKVAAGAIGGLLTKFGQFIGSRPLFERFMAMLERFGPIFIRQFGQIGFNIFRTFLRLFIDFAPLAAKVGRALVGLTAGFDKSTWGFGKSNSFQAFVAYVRTNGPLVLSIFEDLFKLIGRFVIALAPVGGQLLVGLAKLMDLLANAPVPVVLALGVAVAAIFSPIAAGILAVAALVAIFDSANDSTGRWHDTLQSIIDFFRPFAPQLQALVKPAIQVFTSWVDLMRTVWDQFGGYISGYTKTWIGSVLLVIHGGLKVIAGFFQFFSDLFKGNWSGMWKDLEQIASGAWEILKGTVQVGWANVKLVFQVISKVLGNLWQGIWDNLKVVVSDAWGGIKSLVSGAWDDVKNITVSAINLLIGVLNKLIGGVNTILGWVGVGAIPTIKLLTGGAAGTTGGDPGSGRTRHIGGVGLATGGIMPGYTPGRDVHHFWSPTGGRLELSGGEPVMRPEFGAAVGHPWIHAANAAARTGGVGGVRRFLGLAAGGIWRPIGSDAPITQGLHDQSTGFPALDFGHTPGAPVAAVAPGRVVVSRDLLGYEPRNSVQNGYRSYGRYLQILHSGFQTLLAHLSGRLVKVGQTVSGGQVVGFSGNTGHVVGSGHLHFGVQGRSPYDFVNGSTDYSLGWHPGGIGLPSVPGIPGFVRHPLDFLKSKIAGAWDKAGSWLSSPFGQMLTKIPPKLAGLAAGKVTDLLAGAGLGLIPGVGGLIPSGPVSGAEQAQAWARSNLPAYGWGPEQFQPLLQLWTGESGWRWNARNSSSGAYGIPQALPPEKMGSVAGDWLTNPITQMRWGLGYIKQAYGSPAAAFSAWAARDPHWYKDGGILPPLKSWTFDWGGVATGVGNVAKRTPDPEMWFNPQLTQRILHPERYDVQLGRPRDLAKMTNIRWPERITAHLYDTDRVFQGTIDGRIDVKQTVRDGLAAGRVRDGYQEA